MFLVRCLMLLWSVFFLIERVNNEMVCLKGFLGLVLKYLFGGVWVV